MNRRWVWIGLLGFVALGCWRLRFDVEVLNLLPSDLPAVEGLKLYQRHFAGADELWITVEGADPDDTEEAARSLAATLRAAPHLVASATWQAPWAEHPEQTPELLGLLWINQPPGALATLRDRLADPKRVLDETRERLATSLSPEEIARLSYDPFRLSDLPAGGSAFGPDDSMFASDDGLFRVIFLRSAQPLPGYPECDAWLRAIRGVTDPWLRNLAPDRRVELGFTGRPAYVAEIAMGMRRDMTGSMAGTTVIIAALFGWAYRSLRPLLRLVALLVLTLGITLAAAGFLLGTLNVVSFGFAAIVLGLVADYGVVLYEESRSMPGAPAATVRRRVGRGILGGAATTACGFIALSFEGLPGLEQLGVLVAVGTLVGAFLMLFAFLPQAGPPADRSHIEVPPQASGHDAVEQSLEPADDAVPPPPSVPGTSDAAHTLGWALTAGVGVVALGLWIGGLPPLLHSSDPLRPIGSAAYQAGERMSRKLARAADTWWVLVDGRDEQDVAAKLARVREQLGSPGNNLDLTLPDALWPNPANQRRNQADARALVQQRPALRAAAIEAGFATNALSMLDGVLSVWSRPADDVLWPLNPAGRWAMDRFTSRDGDRFLVAGMVHARDGDRDAQKRLAGHAQALWGEGIWLTSWSALGNVLLERVEDRLWPVMTLLGVLMVGSLWLTFGRWGEVLMSLASLACACVGLLGFMKAMGWSWNLMNLVALPLLLGAGVDYGIHMQLSLRRHRGDLRRARATTGRALVLCAATTAVGFGSLSWSSSAGLASLGQVCAAGVTLAFLSSVLILPVWWIRYHRDNLTAKEPGELPGPGPAEWSPSPWYARRAWALGMALVRSFPTWLLHPAAGGLAWLGWILEPRRRAVVEHNLLPALDDDRRAAARAARSLYRRFGRKIVDLLRFEAGLDVEPLFDRWQGWEHFRAARESGRGILLVTVHLGNWELGAPLLVREGVRPWVLSQPEPDDALTALRSAARARQGVETVIVGRDPFAIVPVVRHLTGGGTVALLLDRPSSSASAEIELFGRPFRASTAAAELARATGCTVLPVAVVESAGRYEARMLPPANYSREDLRDAEGRRRFTQEIMRALEPVIRQHPDQWYHFVPVWPFAAPAARGSESSSRPG